MIRLAPLAAAALLAALPAQTQTSSAPDQQGAAPVAACRDPSTEGPSAPTLLNLEAAIKASNKAVILVIGGNAASRRGRLSEGYFGLVRRYLERAYKGLDLTIAHRGAPGMLARDAGETIRVEAVLTGANLVLWQVGAADAMARIAPEEFRADLVATLDWLKEHKIDVMLVGLNYSPAMASDAHYQQIRDVLRQVAQQKGVPRVRRYEAAETLSRMRAAKTAKDDEADAPGAQECLADWLAQAIVVGLFGRRTPQEGAPSP